MPNFGSWFTEDTHKLKRNQNSALDRIYIEETYSLDSNLDTESVLSYLSNPVDARSIDSLPHDNLYETVDPFLESQNESKASSAVDTVEKSFATDVDNSEKKLEKPTSYTEQTSVSRNTKEITHNKTKDEIVLEELTTNIERGEFSNYFSTTQVATDLKTFQQIRMKNNNDDGGTKYEQQTKKGRVKEKQKPNGSSSNFTIATTNEHVMEEDTELSHCSSHLEVNDKQKKEIYTSVSEEGCSGVRIKVSADNFAPLPAVGVATYVRSDQFNKVSPFDDVPGFEHGVFRSSLKARQSPVKNKNMLSTHTKLSKSISAESSNVAVERNKWIQFDDSVKTVNNGIQRSTSYAGKPLSPSRKNWISFDNSLVQSQTKLLDYTDIFDYVKASTQDSINHDVTEKEQLIESNTCEENIEEKNTTKTASVENLLSLVNQTVSLLKNSITNPNNVEEEKKSLFRNNKRDDDSDSDLSDIVVSLDYESEEENRKLRDTPIKQFTDVSLFQAASAVKNELRKPALSNSINSSSNIDILTEELQKPLDDYPDEINRKSWPFWFRYPEQKRRIGGRKWLPVTVSIDGESIKVEGKTNQGREISREIPLHPFFVFTIPVLHSGNTDGRMRSVKLQYVRYRETRKLKSHITIEHTPIYTPVLKLASRDTLSLSEFTEKVDGILRRIPTHRDKGITYRHEEIFIDCDDECQFLLRGDGDVLKYNITAQIRLRVFVTGNPELKLFLNDISSKEILSKTKERLLRETKTSLNWITPEKQEYHPCVDIQKCESEGGIVFTPPDGCSFELLRYRLRRKNKIPLIAKSSLELLTGNSVRLQASVQVNGDVKSLRHKRNDVVMYFPIPSSWSTLFLRSRSVKGTKKYIKTNVNSKLAALATATLNRVTLQVSCGRAKYEPAYGSIVWRLGVLPIIQDGLPADAAHTFQCYLELPFPLEFRDEFQPYSYVEFNIAHPLASGTSVEEILISDGRVPDKWICYRAHYLYKILMTLKENGKVRESPNK